MTSSSDTAAARTPRESWGRSLTSIPANGPGSRSRIHLPGVYFALYELADGDPDPQTGRTARPSPRSIRFKAIPAFVVDTKTKSANEDLERQIDWNEKRVEVQ